MKVEHSGVEIHVCRSEGGIYTVKTEAPKQTIEQSE